MKTRFPSERRASWRERFVAIAREAHAGAAGAATPAAEARPRPPRSQAAKAAVRVRFAALGMH